MSARISLSLESIAPKDEHFSSIFHKGSRGLTAIFDRLLDRLERRRELTVLARMDERALRDIGLTRSDLG